MEITEIAILSTNDGLVRAYVDIVFDNCFMVGEIKVIQRALRDFSFHFLPRSRGTVATGSLRIRPMLKHGG